MDEASDKRLPEACYVYGAGGFGRRLTTALVLAGVKVKGNIDQKFKKTVGREVSTIDTDITGQNVMIGIGNPATSLREVANDLEQLGVAKIWSPVEVAVQLYRRNIDFSNYWLSGDISIYEEFSKEIEFARSCLEDEASVSCFDSVLRYRQYGEIADSSFATPSDQIYAPRDISFLAEGMRFIDAGAFQGDTLIAMSKWAFQPEAVISFEPDPTNFSALASVAKYMDFKVVCAPLGIGRKSELLSFNVEGKASSAFDPRGESPIQVVSLDEMCLSWGPTHIKMDIEGAESEALSGMQEILRKCRPSLALSAYHAPQHHWDLLLKIQSLNLDYAFYFRTYGEQTFDTVFYAIPRESVDT